MFRRLRGVVSIILGGIFLCRPPPAEILFDGEWDGFGGPFKVMPGVPHWVADCFQLVANSLSPHWRVVQEKELGRITAVSDPVSPKHGIVARIELRPGDVVRGGERAEVAGMMRTDPQSGRRVPFPVLESDGHEFYGIAVKLSPDWQSPSKHHGDGPIWGIFLQLHGPGSFGAPPAIALSADSVFRLDMCSGDVLEGGTRQDPKDGRTYSLENDDLTPGHWVQFILDVLWSYSDNGYVSVYRCNEGENEFTKILELNNIATLQYKFGVPKSAVRHYWKLGFYRSATPGMTNVIWLGPLVRGTSFDEVARAAFGMP